MIGAGFETTSTRMEARLLVSFQAPAEDVERILVAVTTITPLAQGAYDNNAYVAPAGIERYRPMEGAAAGAETDIRERPGVVEVTFELDDDRHLAGRVVEAIFQVHSYQEPVIRLQPILSSRSKGLDDSANPNRWWNTTGDWKTSGAAAG